MNDDLKAWIDQDPRLARRGNRVIVRFDPHPVRGRRKHEVEVIAHEFGWELSSRSTPHAAYDLSGSEAWLRNRTMNVAHFVITEEGMWISGWVPGAGATPDEFIYVLGQVAAEADRFEFLSTGADTL
jgi:hypothetical protein